MGPQVQLPQRPDLVWRLAPSGAIQIEDPQDAQDSLARDRIFAGDRRLPQLAPCVRPAPDLLALGEVGLAVVGRRALIRGLEQQIVDALGVGLDVAGEAAEQLADGGRSLLGQELEEDVIGVGDLDQEVAAAASAARLVAAGDRLDQDPGRIGGDAEGGAHRLVPHRLDHGGPEGGAEAQAEPHEAVRLAMERRDLYALPIDQLTPAAFKSAQS